IFYTLLVLSFLQWMALWEILCTAPSVIWVERMLLAHLKALSADQAPTAIIGCPRMTEPSEDIQQMSIGIDGRDELVIMIMQDSLQRIGLQHKRAATSDR